MGPFYNYFFVGTKNFQEPLVFSKVSQFHEVLAATPASPNVIKEVKSDPLRLSIDA